MKLGIVIPYYNNSRICERNFKLLMECLDHQLTDDVILYVFENGQYNEWLHKEYQKDNIKLVWYDKNRGVSYARNQGIDYLINKVDYLLFLDSDDMVDGNYIKMILKELDGSYDVYETDYYVNNEFKEYRVNGIRASACASVIKSSIIGGIRFKEDLQVGEDTLFMQMIFKNRDLRVKRIHTNYYYNYGDNLNSLSMRYKRKEIEKEYKDEC